MVVDSAARFRVKKSESFAMTVWSNVAILLVGRIRVQYDNGQQDDFRLNELTTSSDRSTNFTNCGQHLAKYDGYVTSCRVGSQSSIDPQRGQIYMQLIQVSDPNGGSSSVVTVLSCGYIVAGHTPALGEFVEPGPAGGHGATTRVTKAATAVPAAGLVLAAVPVGAIWRWIFGNSLYTATATVGIRNVTLRFRDASGNIFDRHVAAAPIATNTSNLTFAPNFTTEGAISSESATNGRQIPSPDRGLLPGYDLLVIDTNAIDITDTATLEAQVEEWVMPN